VPRRLALGAVAGGESAGALIRRGGRDESASYGGPRFLAGMRQIVRLEDGRALRLNLDCFRHHWETRYAGSPAFPGERETTRSGEGGSSNAACILNYRKPCIPRPVLLPVRYCSRPSLQDMSNIFDNFCLRRDDVAWHCCMKSVR